MLRGTDLKQVHCKLGFTHPTRGGAFVGRISGEQRAQ